jgi:primosomal replication protein N
MNRTTLLAQLIQRGPARYTPAGLAACDFVLKHESQMNEANQVRHICMEIRAIAFGGLAQKVLVQDLGENALYAGFLTNQRSGRGVIFHVTELA